MALTAYGRNIALDAVARGTAPAAEGWMKFVGLYEALKEPPTAETGIGSSVLNMTGSKAKGFLNGKIVVISALTGAVTNLVAGRPYYVVGELTNSFELALEEGGAGLKVEGHALEVASTKFDLCTEISGGAYARIATAFGAPTKGITEDSTAHEIKVPAGKTVEYAGHWEKLATGKTLAVTKLTEKETFGAEGVYKVTSETLEALFSLA